eukprot:CAMPEP_0194267534 /NCGR_PEP_ID=MMETSP0169-20130528/2017_1 /TAXON_ID=218684 /ORGANISM="Corethron pennatum, Strain L29A3" /LENGTH=146 /DNA_ID=CAMNT_0039008403 /DNA_START=57 /DNA_END=497 /DNA_ORIENTATION=-
MNFLLSSVAFISAQDRPNISCSFVRPLTPRRPAGFPALASLPPSGSYSYVEGLDFDDKMAEIEAMGGDSFFLDDSNETPDADSPSLDASEEGGMPPSLDVPPSVVKSEWKPTDGTGPRPSMPVAPIVPGGKFVWDGTENENAYYDD